MKKRLPGILLCLCMVLTIFPTLAFAEGGEGESSVCTCETACAAGAMNTECPVCGAEGATPESCGQYEAPVCSCETACAAEAMNTECPVCGAEGAAPESCGKYTVPVCSCETACAAGAMNTECTVCSAEGATPESCSQYKAPAEPTAVQQVQALIDALPAADTITAENRGGVETQLTAIDEAKAALTEEERAKLDFTKYEAAIAALNALDGMGGAGTPLPADDTQELRELLANAAANSTVKLEQDYTISETVKTDANFTLDLNGHVIRMTGSGSVIQSTGIVTLTDSNPTATHEDSSLPAGGVITGGKLTEYGGGVLATGVFTMNGGTIYNCRASRGGGVYVGSQFTMNGGAIYNCSAGQHGGGVYCDDGCTFTMTGGAIKGCTASDYGGGVYTRCTFTMTGGTIEDCTAYYGGQAVNITQDFLLANGGTIKDTVYVDGNGSSLKGGDTTGYTRFYDQVEIGSGSDIYYGVYYGGIVPGPEVIKAENYHTVDFQVDGSGSIPKQYFVGIDTAAALQPADPTKEGYTFTGWFSDEDLTTPYDFSGAVDKDITLYAGFKADTYTVTYDPGEYGTGSIPAGTKDHGKDFTLSSDTFTRQGWVQTGWTDGSTDYALGGTYSTDADVTLYPLWTPIETMTVPFTTRVTLGDSGVPGETVFTLELVDAGGKPVSAEGVTVSGSVTTNGAGSYGSAMSLAGTAGRLQNMLGQGVFVRQVDAGAAGWTVDGTVWGVRLYEETLDSRAAYALQIFPATVSNGSYVIDASAGPVAQMQFTNVYTAHDYQLKHDEDGHWEECACKDVRNEEPHRFGDWVVTKKPTGTASGLQERECAICHYKEIVWLAPLSPTASPATGDNSKLTLWLALLGASAAGLSAAALYGKRRKGFRH